MGATGAPSSVITTGSMNSSVWPRSYADRIASTGSVADRTDSPHATRRTSASRAPSDDRGPCRNSGHQGSRSSRDLAFAPPSRACNSSARRRHRVTSIEQRVDRDARHAAAVPRGRRARTGVHRARGLLRRRGVPSGEACRPISCTAAHASTNAGRVKERAVLDRLGDSHEVLLHHATSAEVEVTDLAVAHLARWEDPRRVPRPGATCADTSPRVAIHVGVCARAIAFPSRSSRYPKPSITTRTTCLRGTGMLLASGEGDECVAGM